MKSFRRRLLGTLLVWIGMMLAGLFIVVLQLLPIYEGAENKSDIWLVLFLTFLSALLLSAIVGNRVINVNIKPVENATETALELAKGNYLARATESNAQESVELSRTINVLARNLQEITAVRVMEQERLKTLIENMGSALIMIDRQGAVSLVNKPFLDEFNLKPEAILGKFYKEIQVPNVVENFIENVFMTETHSRAQIEFVLRSKQRNLNVYGAPVIGEHERWLGIVIVFQDITELKRLEQIRKDFVANVSHELRTPVTSIKGFSETLLDGAYKDTDTLLSFLDIVHTESNRLEMLINDLLDLSNVEQSGFEVNAQPTDMKAVIKRAIEMIQPKINEKSIQLQLEVQPVIVLGDPNRLIQVMMNLLINAVTYSSNYTEITIRLFTKEDQAVIQVADQGIGIESSEISRLFERFYRVDRARSRNSGGTGLGLSIVKHLIEAHHGQVEVDSTVGVGTTFTICLPLAS
ncbi:MULTISPECIES: two-component system histidine kinase PnpS [Planococcus]|uniref:histidine kinase n=1 Tax=Planococcus faecalis TaxID=1598147 RepID=A0ABN4XPF2_9BACL|nr:MULTISPECIES: ATP-binding protein [Planococcus]AQU78979.1 PAS domain-containing sensor histidine kinase [Planococcus faecalis]MDJ0330919.1 ATP-binding protein [Planococcus sp. S3-L1]OHX54718.1 PAS domain-containing sensor histidine kinase [Planococcus faecalis]